MEGMGRGRGRNEKAEAHMGDDRARATGDDGVVVVPGGGNGMMYGLERVWCTGQMRTVVVQKYQDVKDYADAFFGRPEETGEGQEQGRPHTDVGQAANPGYALWSVGGGKRDSDFRDNNHTVTCLGDRSSSPSPSH